MADQEGPNAMALEMAKWLVGWGRQYPAEWDSMYDILTGLWNISRAQYIDNRNHGVVPIAKNRKMKGFGQSQG